MKLSNDCYECLQRLVYQAAELATDDPQIRAKAVAEGLKALEDNFSCDEVSIVVATKIHDTIKKITRNLLYEKPGDADIAHDLKKRNTVLTDTNWEKFDLQIQKQSRHFLTPLKFFLLFRVLNLSPIYKMKNMGLHLMLSTIYENPIIIFQSFN